MIYEYDDKGRATTVSNKYSSMVVEFDEYGLLKLATYIENGVTCTEFAEFDIDRDYVVIRITNDKLSEYKHITVEEHLNNVVKSYGGLVCEDGHTPYLEHVDERVLKLMKVL